MAASPWNSALVVDGAYVNFLWNVSFTKEVQKWSNLIVTKPPSKGHRPAEVRPGIIYSIIWTFQFLNGLQGLQNKSALTVALPTAALYLARESDGEFMWSLLSSFGDCFVFLEQIRWPERAR